MQNPTLKTALDAPYELTDEQVIQFRESGFIKLSNIFSSEVLEHYGAQISRLTFELNPNKGKAMEELSTYDQAFIQVGNMWTKDATAKEFSFSRRLARIATQLLDVDGVRMWHDQALYKEASGGFTPWHADQYYWPMATAKCLTAWIPLQAVTMDMGPLSFAEGTHRSEFSRNLPISDESEAIIAQELDEKNIIEVQEPFALGEVSFHYGWTLHRAGPNTTDRPRKVHTVIYMDQHMRLAEPQNDHQQSDWEEWTPTTKVGEILKDKLNPILYTTDASVV